MPTFTVTLRGPTREVYEVEAADAPAAEKAALERLGPFNADAYTVVSVEPKP